MVKTWAYDKVPLAYLHSLDPARFSYARSPATNPQHLQQRCERALKAASLVYRGVAICDSHFVEVVGVGGLGPEKVKSLLDHSVLVPFIEEGRTPLDIMRYQLQRGIAIPYSSLDEPVQTALEWQNYLASNQHAPIDSLIVGFEPFRPMYYHAREFTRILAESGRCRQAPQAPREPLSEYVRSILELPTIGHAFAGIEDRDYLKAIVNGLVNSGAEWRGGFQAAIESAMRIEGLALAAAMDPIDRAWICRQADRCSAAMLVQEPLVHGFDVAGASGAAGDEYLAQVCGDNGATRRHCIVFDLDGDTQRKALGALTWEMIFELRTNPEWMASVSSLWDQLLSASGPSEDSVTTAVGGFLETLGGLLDVSFRAEATSPISTTAMAPPQFSDPLIEDFVRVAGRFGNAIADTWRRRARRRMARCRAADLCGALRVQTL